MGGGGGGIWLDGNTTSMKVFYFQRQKGYLPQVQPPLDITLDERNRLRSNIYGDQVLTIFENKRKREGKGKVVTMRDLQCNLFQCNIFKIK